MDKRLYRSQSNRVIWGVCGGLSEYLNIDATVIRIGMIFLAFANGMGILAYIIMALIIPKEGLSIGKVKESVQDSVEEIKQSAGDIAEEVRSAFTDEEAKPDKADNRSERSSGQPHWIGIALIIAGIFFLASNFNFFWWFEWDRKFWPLIPIGIGLLLIVTTLRRRHE